MNTIKVIIILYILFVPCFAKATLSGEDIKNDNNIKQYGERSINDWKDVLKNPPSRKEIKLKIHGKILNLEDDITEIHEYFLKRNSDLFSLKMLDESFEKIDYKKGILFRDFIVDFNNFPKTKLSSDISWSENPFFDRNWEWSLHRLILLRYLMAAHIQTNDRWYLIRAEEILSDYLTDNMKDPPPSTLSWQDHSTALRLENIIYLFEYAKKAGVNFNKDFISDLLYSIYVHCTILKQENFYNEYTNHGLTQSYILFWTAASFPEFLDANQWQEIGRQRTEREINFAFSKDGVHVENSPSYHFFVSRILIDIHHIFSNYSNSSSFPFDKKIEDFFRFCSYVIKPDGKLPLLGDTTEDQIVFNSKFGYYRGTKYFDDFLYSFTKGREGTKPERPIAIFPDAGYAIFRDKWGNKQDFDQSKYLIFKAGYLSRGHRQDDFLNIILYGLGEDWIIDSGLYKYHKDDPIRKFMLSDKAHNIVTIDNLKIDTSKNGVGKSKIISYKEGESFSEVSGCHELYKDFTVCRKIEFFKNGNFSIIDNATSNKAAAGQAAEHKFSVLFHIPSDKVINIINSSVVIKSALSSNTLTITPNFNGLKTISIIEGQMSPEIQGFVSYQYGKLEPSKCLIFEVFGKKLDGKFDFVFHSEEN